MSVKRVKSVKEVYLKEISNSWLIVPTKYVYKIQLGKMLQNEANSEEDVEISYFKAADVQWENVNIDNLPVMWASARDLNKFSVINGDLLVCEGGEVGRAGMVYNLEKNSILQNALHRVRSTNKAEVKYLMYILRHIVATSWMDVLCNKATIAHFTSEKFGDLRIPLPSVEEQSSIIQFLDIETAKIDLLISKKQKLIKLLQEKRQSIIDEAVTKGLDPNISMKDSGLEWLGTVPANWNLTKIKFTTKIKGRIGFRGYTTQDIVNYREGALTLGAKHINKKYQIDLSDPEFISWEKYYESPEIMLKINDIVLVQRGSTVGKVAIINEDIGEATINPSLMVLKETTCVPQYLFYFLSSSYIRDNIKVVTSVTAIPMISQEQINNFVIVIPSLEEQLEIADYLKGQSKQIETIIDKINIQIKKIQEYRQSLISEAVTGKIDVAVMERRHNNDH
ncbi:restriction endonuclease subunit S [Paenibacillus illinoisensis]|uniref:restriction endonuclease subunit S n=1 Tax=Paenibacillus illinoisensis TaxID=59845 RepID=UPI00301BD429